jgi:hypothetical protein
MRMYAPRRLHRRSTNSQSTDPTGSPLDGRCDAYPTSYARTALAIPLRKRVCSLTRSLPDACGFFCRCLCARGFHALGGDFDHARALISYCERGIENATGLAYTAVLRLSSTAVATIGETKTPTINSVRYWLLWSHCVRHASLRHVRWHQPSAT